MELFENDECAYVTYNDIVSAYCAQQVLNGYFLAMFGVYLQVKWMPQQPSSQQGNWMSKLKPQPSQVGDSTSNGGAFDKEADQMMSVDRPCF